MNFSGSLENEARRLIRLALAEDLGDRGDLTTQALISPAQTASVNIVARQAGVLAGLRLAPLVFHEIDQAVRFEAHVADGDVLSRGQAVASLSGRLQSLLVGERTCLNFLAHLCGIATLTRKFVDAVTGTSAQIFDTRKTLPGWRELEKFAVRAGGGCNHRMGLFDMVLVKDNHLAAWRAESADRGVAAAVRAARERAPAGIAVEVEVDTLEQFADAIAGKPDLVLLDNMSPDELRRAVAWRNERAPAIGLEASGGITLENVAEIARTGVERISVGALTHSPAALDLAFDWAAAQESK